MVGWFELYEQGTFGVIDIANSHSATGLSVVIPTLNRIDMVQRAIKSVSSTKPERVEIIVVDDGSTADLRRQLPSRNTYGVAVRVYRFEVNRGPQAARNLGIRRARFSHIAFLDSDDEFLTDKIDRLLNLLDDKAQTFDILFHRVDGMSRYASIGQIWWQHRRWLPFTWLLAVVNPAPTPALVIRRRRCLGVPGARYSEDWQYLLHYTRSSDRVKYLDEPLSRVEMRPAGVGGQSAQAWKMRRGEFAARCVLCRHGGWTINCGRLLIGSLAGLSRIVADLVRRRYW